MYINLISRDTRQCRSMKNKISHIIPKCDALVVGYISYISYVYPMSCVHLCYRVGVPLSHTVVIESSSYKGKLRNNYVLLLLLFIWWSPFIPSRNLDEVFTYNHIWL